MESPDLYTKLLDLVDQHSAHYTKIEHEPQGRCEIVSPMRGHDVSDAAKCMILVVKIGKKSKKFVLAVVPGNAQLDLNAIKALFDGTYISFASQDIAEELAGSVAGTVLPFAFNAGLELIVDPSLKDHEYIYLNAAKLDESLKLLTSNYLRITDPRFERITQ
jgi:Ala-tRNA(Pro) deacylase